MPWCMTGPSGKIQRIEANQKMDDRHIALYGGEKRPSKLELDDAASRIDQAELPGAMDFKLPFEDCPCRFLVR